VRETAQDERIGESPCHARHVLNNDMTRQVQGLGAHHGVATHDEGSLPYHSFKSLVSGALKFSVGRTCPVYLLEIEGLLTQRSRPGETFGESVGGILEMDSADWSNGIRYHSFDSGPDTEFNMDLVGSDQPAPPHLGVVHTEPVAE